MKGKIIGYWVTTALTALLFAFGGVTDILRSPQVLEGLSHLGYAPYFALVIGVWKVLAVPAILVPKFPRLKEWAYAGLVFDLTGASASHFFSGDPPGKWITPLVLIGLVAGSWALRPASRKLADNPPAAPKATEAPSA